MKVLNKGKAWSAILRCTGAGTNSLGCNAKLQINEKDIFMIYGGAYCESIPYHGIKCPECNVTTCLEDMNIKIPGQFNTKGYFPDRPEWIKNNEKISC